MIKDKLKEIRENTGMNKKEFANYISVKYTTYNGYETGSREPDSDFLVLIAKTFDVSTDYILGLRDDKDIAHSYQIKASEYRHIEKYRDLDSHGKDMVDTVLDKEYTRCHSNKITIIDTEELKQQEQERLKRYSEQLDAANWRTDIAIPAGTDTSEDDIMDDEKF